MDYKTYHYGEDGLDDTGWGCTYRNIQTIISAYNYHFNYSVNIPTINSILDFFNKSMLTVIKKDLWLEPCQAGKYIETKYNLSCSHLLYIRNDADVFKMLNTDIEFYLEGSKFTNNPTILISKCKDHFNKNKLPIIIDNGVYSYCLLSITDSKILISDPHMTDSNNKLEKGIDFLTKSFWMIMLPKPHHIK